ncbi:30S ribosomal protein S1 homolog [Pyrus x bretschneideri]|uniref:30S ribosomal protein S1 homolog n=1 Tax=Pyrus x bretschneideri TaxID=225117 RepID=UPI002030C16B|nr:30S ribosomal protein S1 homolog [Pyrus x bretschneideri]
MPLQTSALALGSASSKLFTTGDTIAFCNNGSKSCLLNHINFSRHSHKSHCKRRCSVYASSRVSDTQHSGLVQDSAASAEALQDARRSADWKVAKAYSDSGLIYEGMVEGYNGGGLLIKFHSLVGFLPFPQLSPSHFCKERGKGLQEIAKGLPGTLISVKVIQADEENKKLIFSEKEAVWSKFSEQISVGDVFEARVGSMEDYGAFVHLRFPDGLYHLTGLVHVSEVSWDLVQDIRDILTEGDDVRVKIINIDREKSRITLSIKQLEEDPLLETLDKVIPQDGSVDPDSLSTSTSTSNDIEPLPGLASILEELVQEDGIDDVRISRQGFEKRVVSQDLQLWLSNSPAINRKFTLLARAGRQVQEIQLTTTLDQEGIKKALQHVLERVP